MNPVHVVCLSKRTFGSFRALAIHDNPSNLIEKASKLSSMKNIRLIMERETSEEDMTRKGVKYPTGQIWLGEKCVWKKRGCAVCKVHGRRRETLPFKLMNWNVF